MKYHPCCDFVLTSTAICAGGWQDNASNVSTIDLLSITRTINLVHLQATTCLVRLSHAQIPVLEQCLVGSLTGAVASQRVTEAFKGWLGTDGNRIDSANAEASLTVRPTSRAGTKVGVSDPLQIREWNLQRSTDKSYPGDNRLIASK